MGEGLRLAGREDRGSVAAFYASVGYGCPLAHNDRVAVAEDKGQLLAAVRLCREEGALVLRGMSVARDRQGQGLGTRLLEFAGRHLGAEPCWCLPHDHLVDFYSRAGFQVCDPLKAPPFLADRLEAYTRKGLAVVIMRRPAGGAG